MKTTDKPYWLRRMRDFIERLPTGTIIRWIAMSERRRRWNAESSDEATLRLLKLLRQTEPVVRAIDEIEKRQRGQ